MRCQQRLEQLICLLEIGAEPIIELVSQP